MVSPKPLSVFVPDVTLIAFPIPARLSQQGNPRLFQHKAWPAWWQNVFLTRIESSVRVKKMIFDTDIEGKFRRKTRIRPGSVVQLAAF
jgi:hypothetical protein